MKVSQTIFIESSGDTPQRLDFAIDEVQARELLAQLLRIFPQEGPRPEPILPPPFYHPIPYICPPSPYAPHPGTTGDPAPWLHWPTTTGTVPPVWGQSPASEDEQAISRFLNDPKQP